MNKLTLVLVGLCIVIAVLEILSLFFRKRPREYQYKKKIIMTASEQKCFKTLLALVGAQYDIFPQIHLATILDHKIPGQNWFGAFKHIDEKSVDFIVSDKTSFLPRMAIELDDGSHERPDRRERDIVVNNILKNAGLPILHLKLSELDNPDQIRMQLESILG